MNRVSQQSLWLGGKLARTPDRLFWMVICGLGVCGYYFVVITDGHLNPTQPVSIGLTFNSMLEHLLRGEFDVSPEAVRFEGFARDGKVFAYWGIFCALIRAPLLLLPGGMQTDVTFLSCWIAACVGTAVKLGTLWMVRSGLPQFLLLLAILYVVFAGASLGFLKASIYQEVLYWAEALASAFVFLAIKGLASGRFSTPVLAGMALFAGLALLTRVTFGIGLYAAAGSLLLGLLWESRGSAAFSTRVLGPVLILTAFAIMAGIINYQRWGSPFVFVDTAGYAMNHLYPDRRIREQTLGAFNLVRIPYGFDYYFGGLWAVRSGSDFFFQPAHTRLYDVIELPPSSFFVTELFPFSVAAAGVCGAWGRLSWSERYKIGAIAAGLSLPCLLILCAISTAYRYRMDFYPEFEFLLFAGLLSLGRLYTSPESALAMPSPRRLRGVLIAAVVVSIVSAHLELALYKLSPLGMYYLSAPSSLTHYYMGRALGR